LDGFVFHPEAEEDLNEIWDAIAEDNIAAADRVIADFHRALERLVPFPHSGHRRPDLTNRPVRFLRVRDYLMAYAPEEKPLWVIAVLHGHPNPRGLAVLLRGRE